MDSRARRTNGETASWASWRKDEGSNLQWLKKNNYHSERD